MTRAQRGFTLVELIVVMVVMGILAGILVVFFSPAISNYFASARRAALTDVADGAMRRITRDVRSSVSNSVRLWTSQCVEMVPTSSGGRYRTAPDTTWDNANPANLSRWMEAGESYAAFDSITPAVAGEGDWVVIGNQDMNDVYQGVNRQLVQSVMNHAGGEPGRSRITLQGNILVPPGYDGGRYVVVPGGQGPVAYVCQTGPNDAAGNGTGTLFRVTGHGFQVPGSCPAVAANTAIVANHVSSCSFHYNPNPGATQESGYVEVDLTITEANENVRLRFGVHVDNVP